MPRSTVLGTTYPPADLRPYGLLSASIVFAEVGATAAITLPFDALGVQLFPQGGAVRFALDTPPEPSNVITAPLIKVFLSGNPAFGGRGGRKVAANEQPRSFPIA